MQISEAEITVSNSIIIFKQNCTVVYFLKKKLIIYNSNEHLKISPLTFLAENVYLKVFDDADNESNVYSRLRKFMQMTLITIINL